MISRNMSIKAESIFRPKGSSATNLLLKFFTSYNKEYDQEIINRTCFSGHENRVLNKLGKKNKDKYKKIYIDEPIIPVTNQI